MEPTNKEKNYKNETKMKSQMGHRHSMGLPVEKAKDFKGTLKRLANYLKPRKIALSIVFVVAVLSTLFNIVSPKIMGKAITKLFEGSMMKLNGVPGAKIDFDYILKIVIVLIVLYGMSAFFGYIQQFMMAKVSQQIIFDMRKEINHKLSKLPLKFFDSKTHGELLSRVVNDVDTISSTLQQSITQILMAFITILGIVVMMLTISPLMTLVTVLTLPISLWVTKPIIKRSQKFFKGQQKYIGQLNGHIEEMYAGHKIVKAFNHEEEALEKFETINEKLYDAGWKAQFVSGIIMPLMSLVNNIAYVFICVLGGVLVTKRAIEIGDIQAFIRYTRQFSHPIHQVANIANVLQSTIAAAERIFEILDEKEEMPDDLNLEKLESPKGDVQFKSVKFSYDPNEPLLEDIQLDLKSGQTVAIVGPTGAGKTTIVNLMMRFYELDGGQIMIDGIDIKKMKRGDLRNIFGMVLQDTWLFNGSILDNIGYGKKDASEEEIIEAAKIAHADHFIRTLPEGYHTVLNEEASNISQGQKQLLTIARALLANPPILILDEATSSVDTRTEIYIQRAMTELMKNRTNFVIAHRLSTICDADLILVMDKGKIIEKGNHEELLNKNGFYADLYDSQFAKE